MVFTNGTLKHAPRLCGAKSCRESAHEREWRWSRRRPVGLGDGFSLKETPESWAGELHAHQALPCFRVANVDNTTLGGEVGFLFFATRAEMGLRNPDFEVGADGHVETGAKGGAAPAEILAGSFFFEIDALGIATSDLER